MNANTHEEMNIGAEVAANGGIQIGTQQRSTLYRFEARNKDGELLWIDEFHNLVVDVGLNDALDKHLKGSSYTASWFVGLTAGSPTIAAGDTASSHSGWTEVTAYSESVRQTLTLGTVASKSVSNTASKAVFTVSSDSTVIGGAFVISNSTKSGTTGVLYGVGALSGGNRTLNTSDTLSVTVTITASST